MYLPAEVSLKSLDLKLHCAIFYFDTLRFVVENRFIFESLNYLIELQSGRIYFGVQGSRNKSLVHSLQIILGDSTVGALPRFGWT